MIGRQTKGLTSTLGNNPGAPVRISDKAVYDARRRLFIAHGRCDKYIPSCTEVLRVLAVVIAKLLDEADEPVVVVPARSAAQSSSTASGPNGRGVHLRKSATAAYVKTVAARGAVGQISRLKVTVEAVRAPISPDSDTSAPELPYCHSRLRVRRYGSVR
jgi:hypothetical protein